MTTWMTPDEVCEALGIGRAQLTNLARAGLLTRTFDRPDAAGHPRYTAESVSSLVAERTRLVDPKRWMSREEACALLEVTPRRWVSIRRAHDVGDNGTSVTQWQRYSRADVLAVARTRQPGVMTRFLTERQAAEQLGVSTGVLRSSAQRTPTKFGYNPRNRRYSAARVAALAPTS